MSNSTTLLDQIATNQANKEAVANALFDAASPATLWGRHSSTTSGLTWGYYGGQYETNAIVNGTLTLTASTTNYVYASVTTGAVSVNTTGFPGSCVQLYTIVTGTASVTSYTDLRSYIPYGAGGSSGTTPVSGGGTGLTTITAHGVMLGEGTSNVATAGPNSASGIPLISQGASADPIFGAATVPGGGTGLTTITAHAVLIGEGTSNVGTVGPSSSTGLPLVSQGSSTDPIFSALGASGGGTGLTTITAHAVMVGEGTGAVTPVGPSSSTGLPLVSQGASSDPVFAVAGVNGGGTGLNTLPAHAVLIGEGTSAIVGVGPGSTSGVPLISQGASSDPAFGVAAVAGGGTGLTTITAHGVMLGEGTSAVAAVAPNATSGLALISQGSSADPIYGKPTGTLIGVQVFTASGTYTPTIGTNSAIITGCGGGGGGGGTAATGGTTVAIAGPGSPGSWGAARITSPSSQAVTIGAAGAAGAAGNNGGGAGGQTSVGTYLVCPGANGGAGGAATAFANTTLIGLAGTPGAVPTSSGTLLYGAAGALPAVSHMAYNGTAWLPSTGGSGPFGSGGYTSGSVNAAGGAGTGNGAGGSGAVASISQGTFAGGAGTTGLVIIYDYA